VANLNPNVDEARERARQLYAWADGYEDTNERHARRCRVVARSLLDVCDAYEAERDGRVAAQANYERALATILSHDFGAALIEERARATAVDNPFVS